MPPLETLLSEKRSSLTKVQEKAMEYIIENKDEALFLTASRLAQKSGVSEATVVRLAQVLGFHGYPEMQRMLRREFQDRLARAEHMKGSIEQTHDEGDILAKVFQQDIQNLSQTLREVSVETFRHAVRKMTTAPRVYIVGLHQAYAPALVLSNYLSLIRDRVHLLEPGHGDMWDSLYRLSSGDLVLGISLSRYTRLTVESLAYAREQGAEVGVITDSPLSPLAKHANWVFSVKCRLDAYVTSFTSTMSLINALLTAVGARNPLKTREDLARREMMWTAKGIYTPPLSSKNHG